MAKKPTHPESNDEHSCDGECELRSGPIAGTAIVSGEKVGRRPVQYANVDGMAIFEGDIILGTVEEVEAALQAGGDAGRAALESSGLSGDPGPVLESVGITGATFRWPNARIPYQIAAGLPDPARVTGAIAHWESRTRIRFVLRTAANAAQFPDFVEYVNGGGCSSQIGRRGGRQVITLGPSCTMGNAIHETGHTVGLWHEQSREDRDTFVRIVWANIQSGMEHNFDQHITDADDLGPYDYGSIMHYPTTAFSSNGQPTIVTLQPIPSGVIVGQRTALSQGDINGVHQMYPLQHPPTHKELAKDPIFDPVPTHKELAKDPIFDPTHKELAKDPIFDPTIKEVARDPGSGPGGTLVEHIGFPGLGQGGGVPFIMGTPSQFGGAGDPNLLVASQLQALQAAAVAMQQQTAQLMAAIQTIAQQLSGGGGAT